MRVSVVLCTHTLDRYDDFTEAVDSVRAQTYDDVELVLVSDGSDAVFEQFRTDFGEDDDATLVKLAENRGLLEARNAGAEAASGDVVAFLDDDAIAAPDWIERLVAAYEERDALAVGGKMTPEWVAGKPSFLPEEFYWLVGVTHRGFGPDGDMDAAGEVRNTFGSNISFRRDVFLDLDGFDPRVGGRKGDANLQAEEPELGSRLQAHYGEGVWYVPDAEVAHKVFEYRTRLWWLLDRAFWQGYSKRAMEVLVEDDGGEEGAFLGALIKEFVPSRLSGLFREPSRERGMQFLMLFVLTSVVGTGYLYGMKRYRSRQTFCLC
ncbi:Succinoglycan biosynthesis protein [Halorhabdus tiamatea SARL4B]|uniref:Succinoglycan biosynthesis protein n=1 Tax=Halorhabdus tiamatea SARL4B TaxID=1033806 RepID=F7PKB8_9EURY|nr:glucosyl-dolichyl phosphate glucuronosyltransferase [Halorhabdus tiamatea]ERJ06985.1 Succinoglycan biosynthesis protein [Halorhabdus tiamatea SARL4B]CCQ34758.1 succinoglycan biosynthesis protein [Halorhabdus tiamatea SARL4B]